MTEGTEEIDAFDNIVCSVCVKRDDRQLIEDETTTFYQITLPVVSINGSTPRAWVGDGSLIMTTSAKQVVVPYIGRATELELRNGIGGREGVPSDIDYGARWAEALRGGHALFHSSKRP